VQSASENPVKVFCRIRPLQEGEESCLTEISQTAFSLLCSDDEKIQLTFKRVFDDSATQKEVFDHVALPLVENLIHGKNGLLFTYGSSGSGKTFTMAGNPKNGGIVPRCLNVIFNSIANYQAEKFVFKPDGMNGFHIQTDADAKLDREKELHPVITPRTQKKYVSPELEL
jgi:kinesin family protein 23